MNQDLIEKNYYESLMAGHYIDVRYTDQEWKIARIVERDKRYAVIIFDATNNKQEQVLLQSFKVAPLRTFTEGYTGLTYRASRQNPTPIQQYKAHLEILQQNYAKDTIPTAFTITQYLRGDLFVLVHSLLCREEFKEDQGPEAMKFLLGFIEFAVKLAEKVKRMASQYFEASSINKYQYLVNQKVALVSSLSEILLLLNWILRVQNSKVIWFFKSKQTNGDTLIKFFLELRKLDLFADLFNINDGNAKWLPFNIHKRLYFLLKKFSPKFTLPSYKLKDYQQVLQIYPFVMKEEQKDNTIQLSYLTFIVDLLKEQSTFEAKLKALQQLKRIVEDETKFYQVDKKSVFNFLHSQQVLEHMTNEYNFNAEIFKRYIPILSEYCKYKSVPQKSINQLFKISFNRHESEVIIIQEIICSLSQFIQVDSLDSIYTEILKNSINHEQTMKFIKNFTINAIANFSQQKSFLSSFFKKTKNSGKYGYYGLDLFFKEIQEDGCLNKQNSLLAFDMIKQIFTKKEFESERFRYILTCISWIQKSKNYGQSIKIIDSIISTYPSSTYFEDSKKEILQKLINKHNFLEKLLYGMKGKVSQVKFTFTEIIKWIYDFLDNYYDFIFSYIKINHIEFLWSLEQKKLLSEFLKKSRGEKKKYIKKIDESIQDEILNKLVRKPAFYNHELIIEQFDALNQIFISLNYLKKKIQVTDRGFVRYITPEMEGYGFYFEFIEKMSRNPDINKIIKKTINIFLRPKDEKDIDVKTNTWKMCLLKIVDKLKSNPQVCLVAIQLFFQMSQGALTRQSVVSPSGNVEIIVSNDNQQRTIILPKISTIWKLRRQIMQEFGLNGDFILYSNNMRRQITFVEEQEFSLNALPLESKGPSVAVIGRRKQKHIQIQAYQKFKEMIQKEEMFYELLFSLNNEKNQELFWKTVDLLPVNRVLVRKIESCENFKKKHWQNILKPSAKQSLQYHLNIIFDLMDRNKKWVSLFYSTEGLSVILECLSDERCETVGERITNRCLMILIKVFDVVDKVEEALVEEAYLTLMAKLIYVFRQKIEQISISVETLNFIFNILMKLGKTFKSDKLQMDVILKILTYGIFKPKNKHTIQFIETDFEHYLINNYSEAGEKQMIYEYILSMLNLQTLQGKEHCEMLFIFFIDYMNTFVDQEQNFINLEKHLTTIKNFILECLQSNIADIGKGKCHPLLFGSLRLLIYTLNYDQHLYDLEHLFNNILNQFLFNKKQKRIKHDTTLKLVYQSLKKILFLKPSLIECLCSYIVPQLVKSPWRKNKISDWCIESKRQERTQFCGLENLGATCYINCLIQQLFQIQHFREHFLSIKSEEYRPTLEENEIYQLQYIFESLKHSNKRSLSIKKFCESFITYEGVAINPMVQSDADQFLNALMEKIESFLKINQRHDIIENTFEGKLSNQLNCEGCPHKSQKVDHFFSIGVNIRGKKCLEQALDGYVQGEILDGDNAYFCEPCQKKVRTLKRLCIKELPNILTIVLKRFEFNFDEMRKIKINSYLKFPQILNMQKYTADYLAGDQAQPEGNFSYALRGTVIHSGTSEGGHYYSFVKPSDKWYCFNDEFVDEISAKKIEEEGYGGEDKNSETEFKFEKYKNAYILFYEKVQTSSEYHKNQPQIMNEYTESIKKDIILENNNAEFLSVILDDHFVRLTQNISCLENGESFKFAMLYFHTVVLRDKNKDEHVPNYFRIICTHLQEEGKSEWYLQQMNHRFFRQFLIEAPRMVRFICTSLVIQAIKNVKNVPVNIFTHGIFCLNKKGMTPFAKIFKELAKTEAGFQKLTQMKYPQRVISLILDQSSNSNFPMNEIESFDSYFGMDSSDKEKQKQLCYASLCESLQAFDIIFADALVIFNKHFSRNGSKILAKKLCKQITQQQMDVLVCSLQEEIRKQGEFKKQDIERYMFFLRAACLSAQEDTPWKISKSVESLKRVLQESKIHYDPMDTLIREINYIASRSKLFSRRIKEVLHDKDSMELLKGLKYWLKDADRPYCFTKYDDFKRRTAAMSFQQKAKFQLNNKFQLEHRMNWLLEKETAQEGEIHSDLEDSEQKQLIIRNKKFRVKEHLGLIKRVEMDGQEKWGLLEKQEFDLYLSL